MSAASRADIIRIKASINEILQDFERRRPILAFNTEERRNRYNEVLSVAPELQPLFTDLNQIQKSRQVELSLVRNLQQYLETLERTPEGSSIPINRDELVAQYEQYKLEQKTARDRRPKLRIPFTNPFEKEHSVTPPIAPSSTQSNYAQAAQDAAESTLDTLRATANASAGQSASAQTESPSLAGSASAGFAVKRVIAHLQGEQSEQTMLSQAGANITIGDDLYQEAKQISRAVAGIASTLPPEAPLDDVIRATQETARQQVQRITDPQIRAQLISDDGNLTPQGEQVTNTVATAAAGGILLSKEELWRSETPQVVTNTIQNTIAQATQTINSNRDASPQPDQQDFSTTARDQYRGQIVEDTNTVTALQNEDILPQVRTAVEELLSEGAKPQPSGTSNLAIKPTATAYEIEEALNTKLESTIPDQSARDIIIGATTSAILDTQRRYQIEPVFDSNTPVVAERIVNAIADGLQTQNITLSPEQRTQLVDNARDQLLTIAAQPHNQPASSVQIVENNIINQVIRTTSDPTVAPPDPVSSINSALGGSLDQNQQAALSSQIQNHLQNNTPFSEVIQDIRTVSGQSQIPPERMAEMRAALDEARQAQQHNQSIREIAQQKVAAEINRFQDQAQTFAEIDDIARKQALGAGLPLAPSESVYTSRTDRWQTSRVNQELLDPLTNLDNLNPKQAANLVNQIISDNNEGMLQLSKQERNEVQQYRTLQKAAKDLAFQKYQSIQALSAELDEAIANGDDRQIANLTHKIELEKREIKLKETEALIKAQQIVTDYKEPIIESLTQRADSLADSMQRMAQSSQWQDESAKNEFNNYYTQRQSLKQVIDEEQRYNPQVASETKQKLLELDKNFLSRKEIIDSYYQSGSLDTVQQRAFDLQNNPTPQDRAAWTQTVQDVFKTAKPNGELSAQEQRELADKASEWAVLQRSPEYLDSLKSRIANGEITYDQAITEASNTTQRQQEIQDTFHKIATDVAYVGTDKVPEDLTTVLLLRALPAKDGAYATPQELREAATDMAIKVRERFSLPEDQVKPLQEAYQQILQDTPNLSPEQIQTRVEDTTRTLARGFYMETARLDNNIETGGALIKSQTTQGLKQAIGSALLEQEKIFTERDAEQALVARLGWDEANRRIAEQGSSLTALSNDLATREMRGKFETSYRMFATTVANDVLTLHSVDPQDMSAEIRKAILQRFDEYFPEDSKLFDKKTIKSIRANFSTRLETRVQEIITSPEFNPALTAAKSREAVIPLLLSGDQAHESQEGFLQFLDRQVGAPQTPELEGIRVLTWEERVRRDLREDYRIKTQDLIQSMGLDATTSEQLASIITSNSFGRLTLEYEDGTAKPYWKETFGKKVKAKKFNILELGMLEKMTPAERTKWLAEHPDKDEQIFLGMLDHGLASLNHGNFRNKLTPDQLKQLRTMLRSYYNADTTNKKIFNEQIAQENIMPSDLALARAGIIGNTAFLRANFVESKIRATPYRIANSLVRMLPSNASSDPEFGLSLLISPATANKQLDREFRVLLKVNRLGEHANAISDILNNGMDIDEAIKRGLLPKLSYFQKLQLRELQVKYSTVDKVSAYLAKNPAIANLLKSRAEFFGKDSVQFLKSIATSDDPINLTLSYGSRYLINKAKLTMLPKYFEFDPMSRRVVFNPLYHWQLKQHEQFRHNRERAVRWVINSPGGKAVKKALVTTFADPVKKLISKLPNWLLGFIGQAILPGVGTAIKLLWKILGFGPLRYIRDLIVLFLTFLVGRILAFILQIAMAIAQIGIAIGQAIIGLGATFGGLGSWLSRVFAPGLGGTAPISISLNTGLSSSVVVGNGLQAFLSTAGKMFSTVFNLNFSAFFSSLSTGLNVFAGFAKAFFLGGWPGAYTYMAVTFTAVGTIAFQAALLTALKDSPDTLAGLSTEIEEVQTNPVTVTKLTDRPVGTRYNPGERVLYTVSTTFPGCSGPYIITDTLSPDLEFDPASVQYTFPNPPIDSITQVISASGVSWTINMNQAAIDEQCATSGQLPPDSANPNVPGEGEPLLNNPLYLSAAEIEQMLRGVNGSPLQPQAGYWAQQIANASRRHGVNPALLLGVFWHEGSVGANDGPQRPAPQSDGTSSATQQGKDVTRDANTLRDNNGRITGCRNLGNQRPGTISWQYGAYNVNNGQPACLFGGGLDVFAYFPTYEQSIDSVAANLASYMTRGIDTITQMADTYSPASDCGTNGVNCADAAAMNASWKTDVSCTITNKSFGQGCAFVNYGVAGVVNGPGAPNPDIQGQITLSVTITYAATIKNPVTSTNGCITNSATTSSSSETRLTGTDSATVQTGEEPCFTDENAPDDPGLIISTLCAGIPAANGQTIVICPTVSTSSRPQLAGYTEWTLPQLKALWKVAHRVAQSGRYATMAVGAEAGYKVEVQRTQCINDGASTSCPSEEYQTTGYYAGEHSWKTLPGNIKLIQISDNAPLFYTSQQGMYEWLFAHEIGHSASHGSPTDGRIIGRDNNTAYTNTYLPDCYLSRGEYVSAYGRPTGTCFTPPGKRTRCGSGPSENHADAVSFYMTSGEAIEGYTYGSNPNAAQSRNIANDYTCTYNSLNTEFFGGVIYDP